jgi:hypothetical protein
MSPEPTDKKSEENEKIGRYAEDAIAEFKKVESIVPTEEGAVSIKLEGQEEILYKSPRELFLGGDKAGRELYENTRKLKENFRVLNAPFVFGWKFKFSDFETPESVAVLKKDLDIACAVASNPVAKNYLDKFAGLESAWDEDKFIVRDEIFQGFPSKDVSDNLRALNFYQGIHIKFDKIGQETLDYIAKLQKENPTLMNQFVDFSLRTCLTSTHEFGFGVFQILEEIPGLAGDLSLINRDFSLPYIFERDYYGRCADEEDEAEKDRMRKEYSRIFNALGLNADNVQQKLKDLGSERKYCAGFFTEK